MVVVELFKLVFSYLGFIAVVTGAFIGVTELTGDLDSAKYWISANKGMFYILLALSFIVYAMGWVLHRLEELRTQRFIEEAEHHMREDRLE